MRKIEINADEFVELAKQVYGDDWRNKISEQLGIKRKSLVLMLGTNVLLSTKASRLLLSALERKLSENVTEIQNIQKRITHLKDGKTGQLVSFPSRRNEKQQSA